MRQLQPAHAQKGFSLLELAIVLAIVGILLSGVLVAVSATTENTRRTQTRQQLDSILEAVQGFAQATGRLPCPAMADSDGREAGTAGFDPVQGGNCQQRQGYVPSATIGISGATNDDGLLTDAWGNPVHFAVFHDPVSHSLTSTVDLQTYFQTPTAPLFRIMDNGTLITDRAAVIIFSTGTNGNNAPSEDEGENLDNDDSFVSTGYSEERFDDIILWMSPYTLYNRLIQAGRQP